MEKPIQTKSTPAVSFHEDWVSVAFAFLIIALIINWYALPKPVYSWENGDDLFTHVFTVANAGKVVIQFFYFYVLAVTAMYFTGKSVKHALIAFPIIDRHRL